jgi:hypothetical protein
MEGPVDREECVYLAKLAEQAERYDEMVSMPWIRNRGVFTLQSKGASKRNARLSRFLGSTDFLRHQSVYLFSLYIDVKL